MSDEARPIGELTEAIGYTFADVVLLEQALTHASYKNERSDVVFDNERFEFLGDSVLGCVMAHLLFERYPEAKEGLLTRYKAVLVSERGLLQAAKALQLGDFLRLGRGEEQTGGREKASVQANAFEALVCAVYLDGGFSAATLMVELVFRDRIAAVGRSESKVDFKTKLQERVQMEGPILPVYEIASWSGPDHARVYESRVSVSGELLATGIGRTKKRAEQAAAQAAFEALTSES